MHLYYTCTGKMFLPKFSSKYYHKGLIFFLLLCGRQCGKGEGLHLMVLVALSQGMTTFTKAHMEDNSTGVV